MSNYTVGYRRPPKDTRFPEGKSGNPKGRPRNTQPDILATRLVKVTAVNQAEARAPKT